MLQSKKAEKSQRFATDMASLNEVRPKPVIDGGTLYIFDFARLDMKFTCMRLDLATQAQFYSLESGLNCMQWGEVGANAGKRALFNSGDGARCQDR